MHLRDIRVKNALYVILYSIRRLVPNIAVENAAIRSIIIPAKKLNLASIVGKFIIELVLIVVEPASERLMQKS